MKPAKDSIWGMTPNRALAKQLAVRDIPSLVYDAVNLEGVAMSLPEVQTLLDGITVGGHKISDQNMAINQADTWRHLLALIENENFTFSKAIALELHSIAGKDEALNWGTFRTGNVMIGGTDYEPPDPERLDDLWLEVESEVSKMTDIYNRAIAVFLKMARAQFFWDVNKRMGRFMMNGILLSNGYPVINVPVKRKQEFNQLMLDYYSTGAMSAMNEFARSCLNAKIINNFK